MTALTSNTDRALREGSVVERVPLQANATVYQGSIVEIDANGRVAAATKGAGKIYFGVAETGGVNGAQAGSVSISVRRKGAVHLTKTGTAARGKLAYLQDDNTVSDVATGATSLGRIIDTDDDGVWVELAV